MINLQRIQDCIEKLDSLIEDVEGLQPVPQKYVGFPVEPIYTAEDVHDLDERIKTWKAVTTEILTQEVGETNPQLFDFSMHWREPIHDYDIKSRLKKKLKNARSDLNILLAIANEKEGAQPQYNDIWTLVHPSILNVSYGRIQDGYYADAVEAACKELNAYVREIVRTRTGEELDGAKLMLRAFSADNPLIKLTHGNTVSDQDTQKGYMQMFAGVMTGIRNPKAHDNEIISREDALRKLIMLSILMYKVDNRI